MADRCGAAAALWPVREENRRSRRLAEDLGAAVVGARRPRQGAVEHPEIIERIPALSAAPPSRPGHA